MPPHFRSPPSIWLACGGVSHTLSLRSLFELSSFALSMAWAWVEVRRRSHVRVQQVSHRPIQG